MKLNDEQLQFLKEELNLKKEDIQKMSSEEWIAVREKCFYIEADELLDLEYYEDKIGNIRTTEQETQRCMIATSIADMKYSQLHI